MATDFAVCHFVSGLLLGTETTLSVTGTGQWVGPYVLDLNLIKVFKKLIRRKELNH